MLPENTASWVAYLKTRLSRTFTKAKDKTVKEHQRDILCIMLNDQKISAQKTILKKQHKGWVKHAIEKK